jgi:2'-5' RNA ligase
VRARLAQAIASARSNFDGEPIRWVHAETLHLTLRFRGEAQPSTLEQLRRAAEERRAVWPAFSFEVRGLGCFPEARRPRVLWAGAVEPSGALGKIAADLEQLARAFGFPAEDRGFSAHLTIGRVKDRLSAEGLLRLSEWLQQSHSASFGTVPVESVELFKSDLKPSGPVYTRLGAFGLQT